jgi:lysylphosphatidylglycerol synthetase-like protein (DUF2156 family)
MSDAAFLLAALVVSILGMLGLALSIDAHRRQLIGPRPSTRGSRIGLRIIGAAFLLTAFGLCAAADPVPMAALVWPMLLTVAAAIVALSLSLHAALLRRRPKVFP